jgi:hypothetical protein
MQKPVLTKFSLLMGAHDYVELEDPSGAKTDPADRVSWDAYSPLEWSQYATPAQFMKFALAVRQEAGLEWGYGEIGAVPIGSADAAWVAAIRAWADSARTPSLAGSTYVGLPAAQTFKYWCAYHNNKVDSYHLEQKSGRGIDVPRVRHQHVTGGVSNTA